MKLATISKKQFAAFLLAALAFSGTAHAWWNDEWTVRKKITVDTSDKGAAITDAIGAGAVLIRLHDGDFQFAAAKEDGTDIRFVAADDKTVLPFHIEKFDSLLSEAFVWVRVPDLKPGTPVSFWLYYGNGGPKAVKADDAKATYDPDTALVYHFSESGAPANDFTMGGSNAQNAGTPSAGSMIGGGLRLADRPSVTSPASPALAWNEGGAMTWSAWIKPTVLAPNAVLFSRREDTRSLLLGVDNGVPYAEVNGQRSPAGAPVAANAWHHLAVAVGGGKLAVFLDGEPYASLNAGLPALNTPSLIGADGTPGSPDANPGTTGFTGELDELQIAKTARPAGFIKMAAYSQGGDKAAKLLTLGPDEQPSNWMSWLSGGTFGVIVKSLTLDGWLVICILALMAVMSWFVMVNKVRYLNGLSKGNAVFMRSWKKVATDLTVLDRADTETLSNMGGNADDGARKSMRRASVYRIYHIGVDEIRHRLAADRAAGNERGLAGRSIQAIRASMDGGLVRETQKINSLIVLLTICISGGPFLGLLGTVIGVMITFAAVAAAGEVNVNAIAPGIAAALLATVAGLAVAIPSLFGYNYILSRVKDAKDDMHIFIDEFVTKMAEFYKE